MSEPLDIGPGGITKLWDNYVTPLTTVASPPVAVPASTHGARQVNVRIYWVTAPTVLSLQIQRSVDNITWATIFSFTGASEFDGRSIYTDGFIRGYITTNTSGTGLTLEVDFDNVPKIRQTANSTDEADHAFLPLSFRSAAVGDGTVSGLLVDLECAGALHYYDNAIFAHLHATAQLRNPVAVEGDLTFDSGCWVQGLGYGVGTYITFPPSSCQTGTFAGMNIEFSVPTGWSGHLNNVTHAVFRFALSGTGAAEFDTSGYFLNVTGLTEGAGKVLRVAAPTTAAASLRCKIGATTYYLPLFSTQN